MHSMTLVISNYIGITDSNPIGMTISDYVYIRECIHGNRAILF